MTSLMDHEHMPDSKMSSVDKNLDKLRMLRILTDEKDQLILDARLAGASWQEIMDAIGMSRQTVIDAAKRANKGEVPSVGRVNRP